MSDEVILFGLHNALLKSGSISSTYTYVFTDTFLMATVLSCIKDGFWYERDLRRLQPILEHNLVGIPINYQNHWLDVVLCRDIMDVKGPFLIMFDSLNDTLPTCIVEGLSMLIAALHTYNHGSIFDVRCLEVKYFRRGTVCVSELIVTRSHNQL